MTLDDNFYETAMQYRNGLEQIYNLISTSLTCQCLFKRDWMDLMDIGIKHDSADLREDGKICIFCQTEYYYASAIGQEIFDEKVIASLKKMLDSKFEEPVWLVVENSDGTVESVFVEKEVIENMGPWEEE